MNRLEGRVATGLDEFMLRLGHLKVLASLAAATSGNRTRLARRLAERLTSLEDVDTAMSSVVGEYLCKKNLSAVVWPDGRREEPPAKARYAGIEVRVGPGGEPVGLAATKSGDQVRVWFQDRCIADPCMRSKVGAVTAETREITNKSGVSHLVDWGVVLGVLNQRLGLTALGRALVSLCGALDKNSGGAGVENPYVIGGEKLIFAWLLIRADGDVVARMLRLLPAEKGFRKQDAVSAMLEVHRQLVAEVGRGEGAESYRTGRVARILADDLGLGRRSGSGREDGSPSTVWHRVSSRLESLVDMGFLEKTDPAGVARLFEYYYRPAPPMVAAIESATDRETPSQWAADHLVEVLIGRSTSDVRECGAELQSAIQMGMGPTGLHIESFCLLASGLALGKGKALSIKEARERLVALAVRRPDVARLSRGFSGVGAEFASINLREFEKIPAEELALLQG